MIQHFDTQHGTICPMAAPVRRSIVECTPYPREWFGVPRLRFRNVRVVDRTLESHPHCQQNAVYYLAPCARSYPP